LSIFSILKKILFKQDNELEFLNKPIISKIDLNLSSRNGIIKYSSDVIKINGNNNVLMIIVGINGSINGYMNKYFQIAKKANEIYGSTVFIFANDLMNWTNPKEFFNAIMNFIRESMVNKAEIKINIFGNSAGGSLAAFYSWEYPEIKNILLVNPPLNDMWELSINGLRAFTGYATLVFGQYDPNCKVAELFKQNEYLDIFNNIIIVKDANHEFKGMLKEFIDLPFLYSFNKVSVYV